MERSYDTGIVIYEIIANGFEHERSQAMIELPRNPPVVSLGAPGFAGTVVTGGAPG
jgi:hypothetical protein